MFKVSVLENIFISFSVSYILFLQGKIMTDFFFFKGSSSVVKVQHKLIWSWLNA